MSIGTTIAGLALAVPAAYAFSRFKFSGRDPAMFSFLLVQMFPGIIILVPYFMVMKTLGFAQFSSRIDSSILGHCSSVVCLDAQRILRYSTS